MRKGRILITGSFLLGIITILIVYFSLGLTGVIRTQVKDITIVSESKSQVYDPTLKLTNHVLQDVEGLYEGDYVVPTFTGSQLDAGTSENAFSCKIYDSKDFDVTDNYNITYVFGALTVEPRTINITVKSYEKVYDGMPLEINETHEIDAENFSNYISNSITAVSGNGLVSTDTINININGSAIDPNTKEYLTIDYSLVDNNNTDVSKNYTVNIINGNNASESPSLSIAQHNLRITSKDYKKQYDGTPLTMDTYEGEKYDIEGDLYDGDILTVYFTSSLNELGTINNDFTYSIVDSEGNDVSNKYFVSKDLGELEITSRELYLSYKETVDYTEDKTPDFNDVIINAFNLSQFNEEFKITGDIILNDDPNVPGTYTVDFSDIKITNSNNEDVTDYFKINTNKDSNNEDVDNTFTVEKIVIEVTPKENTIVPYDGNSHELSLANYSYDESLLLENHSLVESFRIEKDNKVVLEAVSAGEYYFILALEVLDENGQNCSNLYTFVYKENQYKETNAKLVIQKLELSYELILDDGNTKEYDGVAVDLTTLDYTIQNVTGLVNNEVVDLEKTTLSSKTTLLDIDSYEINCNLKIKDSLNNDVTDNYNIVLRGNVNYSITKISIQIQDLALDPVVYDGNDHTFDIDDLNIVGLNKILSTHTYALDIKEGSIEPNYCDAGEHQYTVTLKITDGSNNDVSKTYYNIIGSKATLNIAKRPITIVSASRSKVYDGAILSTNETSVTSGSLANGHSVLATNPLSFVDAGEYQNILTIDIINTVTTNSVMKNYEVKIEFGTFTISKRDITVTSKSLSKIYDGQALKLAECDNSSSLITGQNIVVTSSPSITNVGERANQVVIDIVNNNLESVIKNYNVTLNYGTLKILKKEIFITTSKYETEYTGNPISSQDYTLSDDALVTNQNIIVKNSTTLTNVGSSVNVLDIDIIDNTQTSVIKNYEINWAYGILTVTKRKITIKTSSGSKEYSGEAYKLPFFEDPEGLLDTDKIEINVDTAPTLINVGTCINKLELDILCNGESVKNNYDIEYDYGTLEVTKKEANIKSASYTKSYDGQELVMPECDSEQTTGILDIHEIVILDAPTITDAGSIVNVIDFDIYIKNTQTSVKSNYNISLSYGTLTITKIDATIKSASYTKTYDGTALEKPECDSDLTKGILDSHEIVILNTPSITNVGSIYNEIQIDIYIKGTQTSVISNYNVTLTYGTLRVAKRDITIITHDATQLYNGTELSCLEFSYSSSSLAENQTITCLSGSTLNEVGECLNELEIEIRDSESNLVNSNYNIIWDYGTLTILDNPDIEIPVINVKPARISMLYNGNTYSGDVSLVFSGDILPNYSYSYNKAGINVPDDAIQIGVYDVSINEAELGLHIFDASGNDITSSFIINYSYDYLVICRAQLELSETNTIVRYTGSPYTFDVSTNSVDNIKTNWSSAVEGFNEDDYTITIVPKENYTPATITNPGRIQNDWFTVEIRDRSGNIVNSEFNIVYKYASLVVTKASLIIESASITLLGGNSYEYFVVSDGEDTRQLTAAQLNAELKSTYNLSFDIEFNFTANLESSGECDNTFVITNIAQLRQYFNVTFVYGKLTKN